MGLQHHQPYQPQPAQLRTVTLTGCPSPIWCEVVECRIYLLRVHNTQIKQHNIHEAALKQLGSSKAPSSSFDPSSTSVKSSLIQSYFSSLKLEEICTHDHTIVYMRRTVFETRRSWAAVPTKNEGVYDDERYTRERERRETMQRKKEKWGERMRVEW